jgi:enoyl-[acyl-carrier protein] reductase I
MTGKNIVVMGVANKSSIAWGVTTSLHAAGANLIFAYRKERSLLKLTTLLEQEGIAPLMIVTCDVSDDASIAEAFNSIKEQVGVIHGIVHSVAFADKDELQGEYVETSRDGYLMAQSISAYSSVTPRERELNRNSVASPTSS